MIYLKYLWQVFRHKWFVFVECCKLGVPWLGVIHDLSKFRPSEFIPYARQFYGEWIDWYATHMVFEIPIGPTKQSVQADFDEAWLHHQHRNKHHWQRWLMTLDSARSDGKMIALRMPDRYRREMLADWQGAGRAYGNPNTREWYLEHRSEITLHPLTQLWVEGKLDIKEKVTIT